MSFYESFINWFKGKKSCDTVTAPGYDSRAQALLQMLIEMGAGTINPRSAMRYFKEVPSVFVPVKMIADAFAFIDPIIEDMQTKELITDHPALDLIRHPNDRESSTNFKRALAVNRLVSGNAYPCFTGMRLDAPPLEAYVVSTKNVNPIKGSGGFIKTFNVTQEPFNGIYEEEPTPRGVQRYYLKNRTKELAQIRDFSEDYCEGISPLCAARSQADQLIEGAKHNLQSLVQGGNINTAFLLKNSMDQEQFQVVEEYILNKFSGSTGQRIGVINASDVDIETYGNNNKDMEFSELQRRAEDMFFLIYKVPLALARLDASTYNNYENAVLAFYDQAVLPLFEDVFWDLSRVLFPRYGLDPKRFRYSYDDNAISALEIRRAENLLRRTKASVESTNEYRNIIGREPVPGGDAVLVPAAKVPLSETTLEDMATDNTGGQENV